MMATKSPKKQADALLLLMLQQGVNWSARCWSIALSSSLTSTLPPLCVCVCVSSMHPVYK